MSKSPDGYSSRQTSSQPQFLMPIYNHRAIVVNRCIKTTKAGSTHALFIQLNILPVFPLDGGLFFPFPVVTPPRLPLFFDEAFARHVRAIDIDYLAPVFPYLRKLSRRVIDAVCRDQDERRQSRR